MAGSKMLSQDVADNIMSMITIEKRFAAGSKLPNELELAGELNVSRTTLREAVRILVAYGVLEIRRGNGTFVTERAFQGEDAFGGLAEVKASARDLYEMRLIFEPEAACLAAVRGTDGEIKRIAECGRRIEEAIREGRDRTEQERAFHKSIAQATHNEFMNKLMPILYQAISRGLVLSAGSGQVEQDTVNDHRLIVEFLTRRDAEGARSAMKIHILHAIRELGLQ